MRNQDNNKRFEDWFGLGDTGYERKADAEDRKYKVDRELKGATGEVSYFSEVTNNTRDGRYWVHVVRVINYNAPERLAAGL